MTKEVLVSVTGLQLIGEEQGGSDPIEMVTVGEYHYRNGKHFIKYDEVFEGLPGITVNLIKVGDGAMEVRKKGATNVHMVFDPPKKNITFYHTPYGSIQMGIAATKVECREEEENIAIHVDYFLELNEQPVADCYIQVNVQPKTSPKCGEQECSGLPGEGEKGDTPL